MTKYLVLGGTDTHAKAARISRAATTVLTSVAPTTVLTDLRPTALLASLALTTVLAHLRPTAPLAHRAPTTVLAYLRPTAILAKTAPLSVRTSAAHLAFRPRLYPVLAWPLRVRGSLPLRPLVRPILIIRLDLSLHVIRALHLGDAREQPLDVGLPNRRHLPPTGLAPREVLTPKQNQLPVIRHSARARKSKLLNLAGATHLEQ